MGELLKNVRVAGGAMGAIGIVVALGIYQPTDEGSAMIMAVVGALGGGAVGAVFSAWKNRKAAEAPKS